MQTQNCWNVKGVALVRIRAIYASSIAGNEDLTPKADVKICMDAQGAKIKLGAEEIALSDFSC